MRLFRILLGQRSSFYKKKLDTYSQFYPAPLSLKKFTEYGHIANHEESFQFLRTVIPVRLAIILKEFTLVPDVLAKNPSISEVVNNYQQSFLDILQFEEHNNIWSPVVMRYFTECLNIMTNRHSGILRMKKAVGELANTNEIDFQIETKVQYFLDRFYMNKISIHMLTDQYKILHGDKTSPDGCIGSIDPKCDVVGIVQNAYNLSRFICNHHTRQAPSLIIKIHDVDKKETETLGEDGFDVISRQLNVVYVPRHLFLMVTEVLKNAMRAVVETCDQKSLPPIECLIVKGGQDLTIKISDQGGGISHKKLDSIFSYLYSTAPRPNQTLRPGIYALTGCGHGIPLSRLYARYFHGDLVISSCEGYGTDVFLYLKTQQSDANECLPVYNATCKNKYVTDVDYDDWSDYHPDAKHPRIPPSHTH